ncbi:FUSC family protein [Spirosoma sp. RP8]|uniref:FUSC family protein n=1 Tax=Spirosoma liriopis TaxID=2937440 RepID=A0ABT0HP24_9BACT|nr:FUSC family membrane protein [Spirosoma liriopis]MCK8493388.1 FUSC family protein [Spirosoma liriopis]
MHSINRRTRQVNYFLSGQHFSNGFRTTVSILLPSLILAQFDQLTTGMAMSMGALSVSLSDAPGPIQHRRNAMAATVVLGVIVAIVTGFARMNDYTLGVEILFFGFLFSMLAVYGVRATSVGTAAILIMILTLDRPLDPVGILREAGLILVGGVWYTLISLVSVQLRPYRLARQSLGLCIHEIAKFMSIKADFYDTHTELDTDYRRLLAQQVTVSEKQDEVRELLFKNRQFVAESTNTSRLLVLTFVDTVDLFEQIVTMYYDYAAIRERFGKTRVLNTISRLIHRQATELDYIGLRVQSVASSRKPIDFTHPLNKLKSEIDALGDREGSTLVLKKILVGLRNISQRLAIMQKHIVSPDTNPTSLDDLEYGRFVSHQAIDVKSLRDNLTLNSSVFRHSVRVALAMLLGFIVTQLIDYGHHSYWVLLTISVILKPAFSLTKQRNIERIIGTFAGGVIGLAILKFIPNTTTHFVLMVLFMLGTYSAQRVNYIIMVICLTPYILILFNFLGISYYGAAEERLLDTILGGAIAFAASYLVFPRWESEQLTKPLHDMLNANVRYTQLLLNILSGVPIRVVDYKLARKDVYVTSANMAAAFERMVSEPKHKQRNERLIYKFVVLNHILSSNIATITSTLLTDQAQLYSSSVIRTVKRALFALTDGLRRLDGAPETTSSEPTASGQPLSDPSVVAADDPSLTEQLNFIQQISSDISKLVDQLKK